MDRIVHGLARFRAEIFPRQRALFERLVREGQQPHALVIACSDSRVSPELITQSGPGELFVCRNAGNIVPPYSSATGGVSATIEYAVLALGVRDIIVCGHSDCGAMKALRRPESLADMPVVGPWLRHADVARRVVCEAYPSDLTEAAALRALTLENVTAQLDHLRTHPSVAARIATGQLQLHGWYLNLETGEVLALDGETRRFLPVVGETLPVAVRRTTAPRPLLAAE